MGRRFSLDHLEAKGTYAVEDDLPATGGDVASGRLFQRWYAECMAHLVTAILEADDHGEGSRQLITSACIKTVGRSAWWVSAYVTERDMLTTFAAAERAADDIAAAMKGDIEVPPVAQ